MLGLLPTAHASSSNLARHPCLELVVPLHAAARRLQHSSTRGHALLEVVVLSPLRPRHCAMEGRHRCAMEGKHCHRSKEERHPCRAMEGRRRRRALEVPSGQRGGIFSRRGRDRAGG